MEKKKSRSITVFIILLVIFLITVIAVIAKYYESTEQKTEVRLEDFAVTLKPLINGSPASIDADGTMTVSEADYKDQNFSLSLNYEGYGKSYVRVLIKESWIEQDNSTTPPTETVLLDPAVGTVYDLGGDMKETGGYLYIKDIAPDVLGGSYPGSATIPVIKGIISKASPANATHVKLTIKVDAVQYNRAEQIWGINPLPIP